MPRRDLLRVISEVGRLNPTIFWLPELKGTFEYDDRMKALDGAHAVAPGAVQGRRVLLFDDLYRSGATMNTVADTLYLQGGAADVLALTITATRSHR